MTNHRELAARFTPQQSAELDKILTAISRMGYEPSEDEMEEIVLGIVNENWGGIDAIKAAAHKESDGTGEAESEPTLVTVKKHNRTRGKSSGAVIEQIEEDGGGKIYGTGGVDESGEAAEGALEDGGASQMAEGAEAGGGEESEGKGKPKTKQQNQQQAEGESPEKKEGQEDQLAQQQAEQKKQQQKKPEPPKEEKKKPTVPDKIIGLKKEKAALKAALAAGLNVLLIGETGTCKTTLVKTVAKELGQELVRINLDGGTSSDQLVGRFQVRSTPTGPETYFQEGALVRAMRNGCIVLLDEINAALADVLFSLHAVLEDEARLFIAETDDEVLPHADFRIVATMNPTGDYAGTRTLNHALYSRFGCVLRFDVASGNEVLRILKDRFPASVENHLLNITMIYAKMAVMVKQEKINTRISVRECISAAALCSTLGLDESVRVSMLEKLEPEELKEFASEMPEIQKQIQQIEQMKSSMSLDQMADRANKYQVFESENIKLKKELEKLQGLADIARQFASKVGA